MLVKLNAKERKHQIIEKATMIFAQHGYGGLTIRGLAEACEISEPAIYKYFESKDAIYGSVLDNLQSKLDLSDLKSQLLNEHDVGSVLLKTAHHMVNTYKKNPELTRILLFCSLEKHDQSKSVFQTIRGPYVELLARILEMFRQNKKIRDDVEINITSRCFIGMVMDCSLAVNLWHFKNGKNYKINDVLENTVPLFARGLIAER